ncbi:aminotransferase class V-fold PLP-dependent enzyme [Longimicrobium terrae]|uniref:Selenocysteine lyase/cysteine desulfurase n=1 Tax=Longimicrobium terrae TaxID=1639882 RepID=A0A841H483_9BACT|nr:aminotransferase class V-fold PLP-dependent enzyme [Longimicrobium terrae]MBB4638574.1 selenocysteine lyase/cysteine desulfurase [Longimicrobium terrae]MBB6072788.1 selenocysteine lyase/cysteine desulfurase [Longimicrobium terrae]NNC30594.1 aminotransferase class V-fold PLP-dependent enzyme [Longimicrobium terrae]
MPLDSASAVPAPAAPDDFRALRDREFPYIARSPYLNAASMGPLPERARRAIDAYTLRRADIHALRGDDFEPTLARCRRLAATLVGADADEIALLPNTSFGLNLAAHCLPMERGSRIVVSDREFPANVYPWMALERAAGITVTIVPTDSQGHPDESRLMEEIARGDVRMLAVSAVQFTDGWRADLETLGRACRRHDAWFVVDGIQAVGQLPVDVRAAGIDLMAIGAQKWLCSPFGTGFTYVRRELIERMEPAVVGWTSQTASADLEQVLEYGMEWLPGARRFEVSTQPFQDYAGMAESLQLVVEADPARIQAHVAALIDPLAEWLHGRGIPITSDLRPERRSGIFSFRPFDVRGTFTALNRARVGCVVREGAIRLAPHLYNQPEDMARLMDVLDGCLPR